MSNVLRLPCAATRSSHAVAGLGRHLNFAVTVAWLGIETQLGSCYVATYSHLIEKQAAAGEFKLASVQVQAVTVGTVVTPEP